MNTDRMQIELRLTGLAYGGDAFGRDPDGRMTFVPYALPGERIRAEIVEAHQSWARARCLEVLEAAPSRVAPRCRHFTQCGGCHYQHLAYPDQLEAKQQIVSAQLHRLGGFVDPPVEVTRPSPSPWNTRNQMQFGVDGEGRLTLQAAGAARSIAIAECHLPEAALADLWPRLDLEAIEGLTRLVLRSGAGGDCLILFEAETEPEVEFSLELPVSAVWSSPAASTVLGGSGQLTIEVRGFPFAVSAASFFQVHTALAAELVELAVTALEPQPGRTVFDLYAGVGLFSAFLAQAGATVLAVESSPDACRDFEHNLDPFETVSLYQATVEQALPALPIEPDAILVDPPRAGLGAAVVEALLARRAGRLVYVSCDPATLARDGRRLAAGGYHLDRVTPLDLFPQTYHIETVSVWTLSRPPQAAAASPAW